MTAPPPARPPEPPLLLEAEGLGFAHAGQVVLERLSFRIHPGLTLVRGGDGRGKSTLLRLMAGALTPTAGRLRRHAPPPFLEDLADPAHDPVVARAWLAARRARFGGWDAAVADRLADAFGLAAHLDKPVFMLSTGSRRKLGLVAAAASGAPLTLVDTPFAALDAPSARVLCALLAEAAGSPARAWVVADHARPDCVDAARLAGCIELGD